MTGQLSNNNCAYYVRHTVQAKIERPLTPYSLATTSVAASETIVQRASAPDSTPSVVVSTRCNGRQTTFAFGSSHEAQYRATSPTELPTLHLGVYRPPTYKVLALSTRSFRTTKSF